MEKLHKCIYCNAVENLTISHIIPDAMTKNNVTYYGVCKTKHNSEFSDKFEDKIIKEFSYVSNIIGIKTKSNKKPIYPVSLKVCDNMYCKKIASLGDVGNESVIRSNDGHQKFGPIELLEKIPHKGEIIPFEDDEMNISIDFDVNLLISMEMGRFIAKISYEWICKKCDICEKYDFFNDIISYIEEGKGSNRIKIMFEKNLYEQMQSFSEYGDHCIISFFEEGKVKTIISLFGIAVYYFEFMFPEFEYEKYKNNIFFINISTSGTRIERTYSKINLKEEDINLYLFLNKARFSIKCFTNKLDDDLFFVICGNIGKVVDKFDNTPNKSFSVKIEKKTGEGYVSKYL